jgi:hypothetical protein
VPDSTKNINVLILTLASCIFGYFFSRYLLQYTHRTLEVLRTRYDWLLEAEATPELSALGADLFTYEAQKVKDHKIAIAEGFGQTHARFARVLSVIFLIIGVVVVATLELHYVTPLLRSVFYHEVASTGRFDAIPLKLPSGLMCSIPRLHIRSPVSLTISAKPSDEASLHP